MKTDAMCMDALCDHSIAERPRYYARQLITDEVMRLEQSYFLDRMRRHNRLLHGWGVVCGAQVCAIPQTGGGYKPWDVVVRPGYILGPAGHEIILDCDRTFDLRTRGISGVTGEPCIEQTDPWCSQVFVQRAPSEPLYVAVKYKECMTRPVRVQPVGCGCDETQCEFSRLRDGYEIGVLTCCPESHLDEGKASSMHGKPFPHSPAELQLKPLTDCPNCPDNPWVVLAEIELGDNGEIKKIDNCSCRRIVVSLSNMVLRCATEFPTVIGVTPDSALPGNANLLLSGTNFKAEQRLSLGRGITVSRIHVPNPTMMEVDITIAPEALPGDRVVTLINPDCSAVTFAGKFEVKAAPYKATITEQQTMEPSTNTTPPASAKKGSPTPQKRKKGGDKSAEVQDEV
jgi:hypothetical protein